MGKKSSKFRKFRNPGGFTEEEVRAIEDTFNFCRTELNNVEKDVFMTRWKYFMVENNLRVWVRYLFPEANDGREKLEWSRLIYLHQGQISQFFDEKAEAINRVLLNLGKEDPVEQGIELFKVKMYFSSIIESYLRSLACFDNDDFNGWLKIEAKSDSKNLEDVIDYLISTLKNSENPDKVIAKDVEDWLRTKPIVSDILNGLLNIAFGLVEVSSMPCALPKPFSLFPTILDISHVMFLCSHMTKNCSKQWQLRFNNQEHGSNYTLLCHTIVEVGPTLLIIKDQGNHIFGCFASESWKQSTLFFGDCRCFLFQLHPVLRIFEPSGNNNNFMYHNANQHTLPNGFGMGGQIGFFGLWVDGDFGHGKCSEFCSTFTDYERPSISSSFTFTHIEVWAVNIDEALVIKTSGQDSFLHRPALQSQKRTLYQERSSRWLGKGAVLWGK